MAKSKTSTFGGLRTTLKSLGFTMTETSDHVIFRHAAGTPMILLPTYKSGETLRPIHQMMVWKQLKDAGLIDEQTPTGKFAVPPRKKAVTRPTLKTKT